MKPITKNIIIWTSIVGGGFIIGAILVGGIKKQDKEKQEALNDKEIKEILKKIDNAKK